MSNSSICYVVICNEFRIDCRKLFIVCIRKRCRIVLWNRKIERTTPFPMLRFSSRIGEPVKNIPLEISVKLLPTIFLNVYHSLFVYLDKYRKTFKIVLLKYLIRGIVELPSNYKFLFCNLHLYIKRWIIITHTKSFISCITYKICYKSFLLKSSQNNITEIA